MAEPTEAQWDSIDAELFAGRRISAIKLHREATGSTLKDAKDIVEAREKQLRESNPADFVPGAKSGCMIVLLLMIGAFVTIRLLA